MVASPLVDLLARIQSQHLRGEQSERIKHFTYTFGYLIGCALVLLLCQCHSRVYNALAGPFHLNIDQLVTELDKFNGVQIGEQPVQIDWFSFDREYFQVELGENAVELDEKDELNMFSSNPFSRRLLNIFSPVKEITISSVVYPDHLYIKLPSLSQHYFHTRLPYRFQSFSIASLRCIVRHLGVSPHEYIQWPEKSMYITAVEQIYNRNATEFNMKVIKKCGVFVGYLYRPIGEKVHRSKSRYAFKFRKMDVALDASSPYYPYKTYLLSGVSLSWLVFKALFYVLLCLFHLIVRPPLLIRPEVKYLLRQLGFDSLQSLDIVLLKTSHEHNYRDRLFLIRNQYLLVLNIDLHERQTSRLRQFHILEPFTLISLSHIRSVNHTGFWIADRFGERWVSFPNIRAHEDDNAAAWLHRRLIVTSEPYRLAYEETMRRQYEQNQRRLFARILEEEEEYQRLTYENDFDRIWNRMTSASPHFIADFRLKTPLHVNSVLLSERCSICLTKFERGEHYAQWPCQAQHVFHHACMLNVLRTQNTCPLCRHPVDAIQLPTFEALYRQFSSTITRLAI